MSIKDGLTKALIALVIILGIIAFYKNAQLEKRDIKIAELENVATELKGKAEALPDTIYGDTIYVTLEGKPVPVNSIPDFTFEIRSPKDTVSSYVSFREIILRPILSITIDEVLAGNYRVQGDLFVNRFSGDYSGKLKGIPPKSSHKLEWGAFVGLASKPFVGLYGQYRGLLIGPTFSEKRVGFLVGFRL